MSSDYKPDESILISYVFGELDEQENAKLETYFQENPDVRKKVEEMAIAREVLGVLKDKEVITPPVFMDDHTNVRPLWQATWFKTIISLAASFLLLMVAGRLIGMEVNYRQGELRISFGGPKHELPARTPDGPDLASKLTSEEIQSMINSSLMKNNETITAHWADQQQKIDQSIRQSLDLNSQKINEVMKNAAQGSQDQVRKFVAGLQNENLRLMKDYLQLSTNEQKKYVESLLVDFSKYLQEQRGQDLNVFQTRMNTMEKNSEQFKLETEQILSSIISTASIPNKKNSN